MKHKANILTLIVAAITVTNIIAAVNCPDGSPEVVFEGSTEIMTIVRDGSYYHYDFDCEYEFKKNCIDGGCVRSLYGRVRVQSDVNTQYHSGNNFPADPPFCNAGQTKILSINGSSTISGEPNTIALVSWGYAH